MKHLLLLVLLGCSGPGSKFEPSSPSEGDAGADAMFDPGPLCKGLECKQEKCTSGTTTLTGTVVMGTQPQDGAPDPVYNAFVYVPNAPVLPFKDGVTCDKCGVKPSGEPLVVALTDEKGHFTLENVPVTANLPLVIQLGHWRRQITIPTINPCVENKAPQTLTRLPRNKGEGDIPRMAIASGVFDPIECVLRKMGIDDAEFTKSSGSGRVHLYYGGGASLPPYPMSQTSPLEGPNLWGSLAQLEKYDMVALPCFTSGDASAQKNVADYTAAGGRLYVTDLSHVGWVSGNPAFASSAAWNDLGEGGAAPTLKADIDMTFPKGAALAKWLFGIGATSSLGAMDIAKTYHRIDSVNAPSQRWLYTGSNVQSYSFNTPRGVSPDQQCGRVAYSSFHVTTGLFSKEFPKECAPGPLTAQEKVLEFMLLDLATCLLADDQPPTPPR